MTADALRRTVAHLFLGLAIYLNQHRIINLTTERAFYRFQVALETVRREHDAIL
jgi:hypothetical protein